MFLNVTGASDMAQIIKLFPQSGRKIVFSQERVPNFLINSKLSIKYFILNDTFSNNTITHEQIKNHGTYVSHHLYIFLCFPFYLYFLFNCLICPSLFLYIIIIITIVFRCLYSNEMEEECDFWLGRRSREDMGGAEQKRNDNQNIFHEKVSF